MSAPVERVYARLVDPARFSYAGEDGVVEYELPAGSLVRVPKRSIESRICRPTMHGGGIHANSAVDHVTGGENVSPSGVIVRV